MPKKSQTQQPSLSSKKNKGLIIGLSIFGGCLILLMIIALIFFFIIGRTVQKTSKIFSNVQSWEKIIADTSEPIASVPSAEEPQPEVKGNMNQAISNEIIDLTINSFEKISFPNAQPPKNYEFYKINLSIKNNSSSQQIISLFDFALKNQDKEEFDQFILNNKETDNLLDTIPPQETISENIIFEIKKNKNLRLIFNDQENSKIIIMLK